MSDEEVKKEIVTQLRNIRGHIEGIEKMVYSDRQCGDLLVQISAVKSAINRVGAFILENHTSRCIEEAVNRKELEPETIDKIVRNISGFIH